MTSVRIAHAEPRPGRLANGGFITRGFLIVLADDTGHRAVPIWMRGELGGSDLSKLLEISGRPAGEVVTADAPEELTGRLLRAAGAAVTGVDIDPRTELAGLRLEIVRHWWRNGRPREDHAALAALGIDHRPRYEPRNLAFADGLDSWLLSGSFAEHASHSHWQDYACTAEGGIAVLSSAVPQPGGFAFLGQEMYADDYRGAVVTFCGEFRGEAAADRAGLFLRVSQDPRGIRGPLTERAALDDPGNTIVTIAGDRDWTSHGVTARVPDDANVLMFGMFLAGRGRIELRCAELTRGA